MLIISQFIHMCLQLWAWLYDVNNLQMTCTYVLQDVKGTKVCAVCSSEHDHSNGGDPVCCDGGPEGHLHHLLHPHHHHLCRLLPLYVQDLCWGRSAGQH